METRNSWSVRDVVTPVSYTHLVLALAVIALFCWFFTGWATQPIREAHAKQNQFVSAASHELRTPMQVIRINAEALKLNPPDQTPFVEQILKELTHMSRLSEDLLLLTAAPDPMAARGDPVEVDELVRSAAQCHAAAAQQKDVYKRQSLHHPFCVFSGGIYFDHPVATTLPQWLAQSYYDNH